MADLIAKIGRFFAEQEAQIQESFTQVTQAPARALLPSSRPQPPVHRIPTHLNAHLPDFVRGFPVTNPVAKPPRSNSLVRRRLSFKSATEPTVSSDSPESAQGGINDVLNGGRHQDKPRKLSSVLMPPPRHALPAEDIWSYRLSGDLMSWPSSSPPVSTASSRSSSAKDEDITSQISSDLKERQLKPRPPQQKHRKHPRKKKRGLTKRSGNQEEEQPDSKELAKLNTEKITAALVLAQERAKRIQQEKLQLDHERELVRQEAALRLQDQMMRIEAIRAKSFRQSSSSLLTTARSSLSESGSSTQDAESVWTADANDIMEPQKALSQFMTELEAQIRQKMSLEMHVKQSCIEKHRQRERVRLKLDKILQQNAVQSSKVARLSAMKASLETELAAVLEDTAQMRQQRRELELADEKERLKRQREAERALQIRLREEEWSGMMEKEKARSQVAAEARAKANKRVEAHSAKLRKMMQAYRFQPHHSMSSGVSSSAESSNNDSDHRDHESDASSSRQSTEELQTNPTQPFKMNFFLPPELADFEEDGICNNNEHSQPYTITQQDCKPFTWQIPSFLDQVKFTELLIDMVSDDENE